jgi:ABC-type transport system substrate-binding protein
MTPQEARDALVKIIVDTSAIVGVSGWKDGGAPDVGSCDAGVPSVNYGYGYGTQPGTDHLGDAQKVAAYWEKLGMSVRVVTSPAPRVYSTGGPVQGLSFSTAPGNYVIAGTSLCVPGDLTTLIDEQAGEG